MQARPARKQPQSPDPAGRSWVPVRNCGWSAKRSSAIPTRWPGRSCLGGSDVRPGQGFLVGALRRYATVGARATRALANGSTATRAPPPAAERPQQSTSPIIAGRVARPTYERNGSVSPICNRAADVCLRATATRRALLASALVGQKALHPNLAASCHPEIARAAERSAG